MGLVIHKEKLDRRAVKELVELCPFSAIQEKDDTIIIGPGCRMCRMCMKKGPEGAVTFEEDPVKKTIDKKEWFGIAVFAEHRDGLLHRVTTELIGKARELSRVTHHPVYVLVIGSGIRHLAEELLQYGADKVYVYDDPRLKDFIMDPYTEVFSDFVRKVKPSSCLIGATNIGRALAPRIAARFKTGLTADCTVLEMKPDTDLVQIRPAFGGNIMAQIITPANRPQLCTVRYRTFESPAPCGASGKIISMKIDPAGLETKTKILDIRETEKVLDISEASMVVAAGRGLKNQNDLALAQRLADALGAQLACSRPLAERGWLDPRRQIGLSGRTVNAKLIITIGVSGAVQFAAGMRGSQTIIAVNTDEHAPIFDIAHYCIVGDLYEVIPRLLERMGR